MNTEHADVRVEIAREDVLKYSGAQAILDDTDGD